MHRHRHHHSRNNLRVVTGWVLVAIVVGVAALVALYGSGGGVSESVPPPRPDRIAMGRSLDFSRNEGSLPSVYVERAPEGRWTYTYRMQGEAFLEKDFLGFCRTIARDAPDMVVNIVPHTAMSEDEIGLVSARIRETGLTNVRVARSLGGSDLL